MSDGGKQKDPFKEFGRTIFSVMVGSILILAVYLNTHLIESTVKKFTGPVKEFTASGKIPDDVGFTVNPDAIPESRRGGGMPALPDRETVKRKVKETGGRADQARRDARRTLEGAGRSGKPGSKKRGSKSKPVAPKPQFLGGRAVGVQRAKGL